MFLVTSIFFVIFTFSSVIIFITFRYVFSSFFSLLNWNIFFIIFTFVFVMQRFFIFYVLYFFHCRIGSMFAVIYIVIGKGSMLSFLDINSIILCGSNRKPYQFITLSPF